jgi:Peptidase_C39 like family
MLDWIKRWWRPVGSRPERPQPQSLSPLRLEPLEDRQLLAACVVAICLSAAEVFALPDNDAPTRIDSVLERSSGANLETQGELLTCWLGDENHVSTPALPRSSTANGTLPCGLAATMAHGPWRTNQAGVASFLTLDGDEPQNDGNSCGPNSAARILRFYGYKVSYNDLKQRFHHSNPLLNNTGLGLPGPNLAALMKQSGYNATAAHATLERVLTLLSEGKPVVAMVRVGTINVVDQGSSDDSHGMVGQFFGKLGSLMNQTNTFPALHWIALQGFDRKRGMLFFTDTNGEHYKMRFADFEKAFNWECGSAVTSKVLAVAGVTAGSIVY